MSSTQHKADFRLIQKPRSVPRTRRTLWGVVTLACWVAYFFLWLPLITLLLWLLGVRQGYIELYLRENNVDPFLLTFLPIMALIAAVSLIVWAEYNRARFSGDDRREPMDDISHDKIATELGATPELAGRICDEKCFVLHMDEHANPIKLTPSSIPLAQSTG